MSQDFAIKVIGYMYESILETMNRLPFSGRYWMEEIVQSTALRVLEEHGRELKIPSADPVKICTSYLDLLDRKGFQSASTYKLRQENGEVYVEVDTSTCVYRDFCIQVKDKEVPLYCIRLNALRAVLKRFLEQDYDCSIQISLPESRCYGKIFPTPLPRSEIVIREGDILKIAGDRAMLLPMATYAYLLGTIKEHVPYVLVHVLYDAGFKSGLKLARRVRKMYPAAGECLNILLDELKQHGLGRMELVTLEQDTGKAIIRCYNSFQVEAIKKYGELYRTPRVVCDLLRGTFAAFLTELLQRDIFCEEIQCQSMGNQCCEFLTLPLETQLGRGEED